MILYESDVKKLQQNLEDRFNQLATEGKWADAKYKTFADTQMSKLYNDIANLYQTIDNELKPFLTDIYQKLRDYQECW